MAFTGGSGLSVGIGAIFGFQLSGSQASEISELRGNSFTGGTTVGDGLAGGVDVAKGVNGGPVSATVTVGGGVGVKFAGSVGSTGPAFL